MQLDFCFAFRKVAGEKSTGLSIYARDSDVFLVVDADSRPFRDVALAFLEEVESPIIRFYSVMLQQKILTYHNTEISSHFADLAGATQELLVTSGWHMRAVRRISTRARSHLSSIHIGLVEIENRLFEYQHARNELSDFLSGDRMLSKVARFFADHTEPNLQVPRALSPAVEHFEKELYTAENIRSVILASFGGAAVGAILTVLLTRLL